MALLYIYNIRLVIVTWTVCIEICLYLSEQKVMSAGNEILNSHYGLHTSTTCIGLGYSYPSLRTIPVSL